MDASEAFNMCGRHGVSDASKNESNSTQIRYSLAHSMSSPWLDMSQGRLALHLSARKNASQLQHSNISVCILPPSRKAADGCQMAEARHDAAPFGALCNAQNSDKSRSRTLASNPPTATSTFKHPESAAFRLRLQTSEADSGSLRSSTQGAFEPLTPIRLHV